MIKTRKKIMNLKRILPFAAAVFMLSSCATRTLPTTDNSVADTTAAAATTVSTTSVTVTTTVTTAAVTTTAPSSPDDIIMAGSESVEVYDVLTVGDYITDTNVELVDPDMLLDTSEIGQHVLSVPYIYDGRQFTNDITYTVTDTTPPLLLNSGWSPVHLRGTDFDLNDYVGFADNYDRSPTLTYTGSVDPNTNGDYPLTATATDSSGNSTSWDVTITVADIVPTPPDNNERINFSDFMERYAADNVRFGIDVSTWQGSIDFEAVRNAGCSFVIMRIGYYYSNITMDDYFQSNLAGALNAGLDVGVYIYTTDRSEDNVREHARWIAEQLGGTQLSFPVAFDWEEFGGFQKYGMNIHDLNEYYRIFSEELESYGYSAMLYSSKNFLNNFWSEESKALNPVWLAHFTDQTDYTGDYAIWQASSCGRIDGITGDVDLDILYTDVPIN